MKKTRQLLIAICLQILLCAFGVAAPVYAASSGLAATAWPTQTGSNRHTGQSAYEIPANLTVAWAYLDANTSASFYGDGVIGPSGTVYALNTQPVVANSKLMAFNSDGTTKWTYTIGGDGYSSPVVSQDETIYVQAGEGSGKLLAINSDGTLKWQYDTNNNVAIGTACFTRKPSPTIDSNGTVYVVSATNGKVFALNPDGTLKWSYTLATTVACSTPAIGNDGTIFIDQAGRMTALNPDGTLKWTTLAGTGGGIPISASIDSDGNVYGAGWFTDRNFRKYNGITGALMWTMSSNVTGSNGYTRSNIGIINRSGTESLWWQHVNTGGAIGRWVNSSKTTGAELQVPANFGPGTESEIVSNASGTVAFGKPAAAKLYAFDPSNSAQLFKYTFGTNGARNSIALGDLTTSLYVGDSYAYYAFKPFTVSSSGPTSVVKQGNVLTIQATSSMLAKDPVTLNTNKVQAIMPDGTKVPLSYVSSSGGQSTWTGSYIIPSTQVDGNYTYTLEASAAETQTTTTTHFDVATSNSNNTGVTSTGTYSVDSVKPYQLTLEAPLYSNDGTVIITGFASDDRAGIESVKTRGVGTGLNSAILEGASWHVTYANVPDGIYEFSAFAYDKSGNESSVVASNKTIVDRAAPTLILNAPSQVAGDKVTITGYTTDGYAGLDQLLINGTSININSDNTFSIELPLVAGANTFTAKASDKAGNTVTKSITVVQQNTFIPTTASASTVSSDGTMPFLTSDNQTVRFTLPQTVQSLQYGKGTNKKDAAVITALQKALQNLNYFTVQATGYFGSKTRSAVKAFQSAIGLRATGRVDYRVLANLDNYNTTHTVTLSLIASPSPSGYSAKELEDAAHYQLTQDLKANRYSEETKFIQKKLYILGYYNGPINGWLNVSTQAAIKQYRADKGLGIGLVDQALRSQLNTMR